MGNDLLDQAFALVERLGLWLSILAWLTVFAAAVGLAVVLKRRGSTMRYGGAIVVGLLSLAAHLADYFVTLRITPDLSMEANPLWRMVVDRLGLTIAKAYGLTGKILLSVIAFELYAWYRAQRAELFPERAAGFVDFVRQLGRTPRAGRFGNVRSFFAFAFALFGPYFFYITFMNLSGETVYYDRLPSPPVAILGYFAAVTFAYFVVTWRAAGAVSVAPSTQ